MHLLDLMETFVHIADAGSLSAAARVSRRSLALVSRQLRALEEQLGAPLVRRTTRRLDLTPSGRTYLEHCRRILGAIDEAAASVSSPAELRGELVVSAPSSFGLERLSPILPDFLRGHPALHLEMRFDDRAIDLIEEGVDLALRAGIAPPDSTSIVARRLATYERILCASPRYLQARGTPQRPEDLAGHDCLVLGTRRHSHVLRFGAPSPCEVEVSGRFRANTVIAIRDAALAGLGIGWLPAWAAEDVLASGALRRVLADAPLPAVELHAIYHRDARRTARIDAFVEYLQQQLPRLLESRGAPHPKGESRPPPARRGRRT
jgi:DNA-binding transcriptional LysR family regulator